MLPMNQVKRNSVYFLADFHLGVPNKKASLEREKKIVRFLESIKDDAKQIYLLGDIFDLWFEYKYVVPKGYVRLLGKLAELTDNGVKIDFFCGNHDFWQKDYFEKELNIKIHKESSKIIVLDGKRFMIGHIIFFTKVFMCLLCKFFINIITCKFNSTCCNFTYTPIFYI